MTITDRGCANPEHEHIDYGEHVDIDRVALQCGNCAEPSHYDYGVEGYQHDDPDVPDCFLIARIAQASPCERPATKVTPACPCECNRGGFCGGCGHAGCGGRS